MSKTAPPYDRRSKPAFFAACGVLLASTVGFNWAVKALNVYLKKEPIELRGLFDTIPRALGRWHAVGKDKSFDEAMIEELGTSKYLDRDYAIDGSPRGPRMNVHVAYYTGMIDAVPHVPDRCLVAAGFNAKTLPQNLPLNIDRSAWTDHEMTNLQTGRLYPAVVIRNDFTGDRMILMPVGDFELRVTEFERTDQPDLNVFGGYFFIANGQITPTPEGVKAMAFKPSEKYAYYCKVQLTQVALNVTQDEYLALAADFMGEFLPELMQRLPDWAEVERRDIAPASASERR
jgi:hypothetical protein